MSKQTKALSKTKLNSIRGEIAMAHEKHSNMLLRRALFKTSDSDVSQDLVQTTFLKTLLYLQKGGKIDLMRSFLNHILNDLIVDEYRNRNHKASSLDFMMDKGFDIRTSNLDRDIDFLDGKRIALLIPKLPKKYEVVIRLRYLRGLSLKEISAITGQSENTVAVQVHRGLSKLTELNDLHCPSNKSYQEKAYAKRNKHK